ncbi:hypothetical protein JKP88DRAFT_332395 [Tribonema minus]|uniref:Uncharacterized protein n=1 Tax=Tribonema minus TaxID=303371 RepID=A0A835YVK8_9STRA|nr:hypothetical protein JKP88DRAFT_332395 [Tribonema minus]
MRRVLAILAFLMAFSESGKAFRIRLPILRRGSATHSVRCCRSRDSRVAVSVATGPSSEETQAQRLASMSEEELIAELQRKLRDTAEHHAAIRKTLADVNATLSSLGPMVGGLMRVGVRNAVLNKEPHLAPLTASNLVRLAGVFADADRLTLSYNAARKLLDNKMLTQVVSHAQAKLKALGCIDENVQCVTGGEVDIASLERSMGTMLTSRAELDAEGLEESKELKLALTQVLIAATAMQGSSQDTAIKVLLAQPAGVLCAVAHACPQALEGALSSVLMQQVLQKAALASVTYDPACNQVAIKVCDVQADLPEYTNSVRELGVQLNVLAWLARLLYGSDVHVELIGELCVPSYGDDLPMIVDSAQYSLARNLWQL